MKWFLSYSLDECEDGPDGETLFLFLSFEQEDVRNILSNIEVLERDSLYSFNEETCIFLTHDEWKRDFSVLDFCDDREKEWRSHLLL